MSYSSKEVEFAAGGIVWKDTPGGRMIAVIHRSRYNDWCLPKGKPKKGENLFETALREVKEETGFDAKITGFAGVIHYTSKNTPKVVVFWHMQPVGEPSFRPSEEVSEVLWLTVEDAIDKIDYKNQKALLTQFRSLRKSNFLKRIIHGAKSLIPKTRRYYRLLSTLNSCRSELEYRKETFKVKKGNKEPLWAQTASELLTKADYVLKKNRYDEAWKYVLTAQRMMIFGYDDNDFEFKKEEILCEAATKLTSWRKCTVDVLLAKTEAMTLEAKLNRLYEAILIRDESFNNVYFRIGLLEDQMIYLFVILVSVILAIITYTGYHGISLSDNPIEIIMSKMLGLVALFGLLGGTVSAILSIAGTSIQTKIPQQIAHFFVTLMRVCVGAASAIGIYLLLTSGIISFVNLSMPVILAFAFVSGFTERLVVNAIESVVSKS